MMSSLIFAVHFAATWYLVGLCWLVQRVQYPLMSSVGLEQFARYEAEHVARIGPVVAPLMLIELVTGAILWTLGGEQYRRPLFVASAVLLGLIWVSTFLVQVPLHDVLRHGFDPGAHGSLVRTNWIRTLAWSARGIVLCFLLVTMLGNSSPAALR